MNWELDLEQLAEDLPKFHNNFFHNISKQEFCEKTEKLKRKGKNMNAYSMVAELSKLIALAGDAHTALEIPKNNMLPIECYWFEEGIYITRTSPEFDGLINKKILEIDGVPLSEIIQELKEMISHENIQFVKAQLPGLLMCTDVLYGLEIAYSVEEVSLKVEGQDGSQTSLILPAVKYAEWERLVNKEDCKEKTIKLPLFRKNEGLYYWQQKIQDGKILYVNYKKCRDMESISVEKFAGELKDALEGDRETEGIILDYRNNRGGNSELFRPFIEWLSDFQKGRAEKFNRPFKIYVVVGRDTFSSALLNVYLLKFKTKAIFVGEATGGKPNCYGEVKYFKLRESGLSVRYSTRYYYLIEDYQVDSFYPDVDFGVSFKDYLENRDACVEWILEEG